MFPVGPNDRKKLCWDGLLFKINPLEPKFPWDMVKNTGKKGHFSTAHINVKKAAEIASWAGC